MPPRTASRRPLRLALVAAWLAPCVVLIVSGGLKLAAPDGTPPRLLHPLLDVAPWTAWQRGLGLVELGLAALVVWPRTRRGALLTIAGVLGAFSLLIAASAADLAFVGDCGCFGDVGAETRYYGWLVLRNAVLIFLAVLGVFTGGERGGRRRPLAVAALTAAFAALVPGVVGEIQLRAAAHDQLEAAAAARRLQGFQGRPLPPLALIGPDGRPLGPDEAFAPRDVLAFVSRDCPHCRELSPALAALHDSLAAEGRRVVMVLVNSGTVPESWRARTGWGARPAVATLDRAGVLALGMDAVPRLLLLGPEREVLFNEAHPLSTSLWKSLTLVSTRVDGLAEAVWNAIAGEIFGAGTHLARAPVRQGEVLVATVLDARAAPRGRLCIVQDGWREADVVELAVGLTDDGRIVDVTPLSAGAYARVFTPSLAVCDSLRGRDLADADSWLAARADEPSLARPVLRSLRRALRHLEPVVPDREGPGTIFVE